MKKNPVTPYYTVPREFVRFDASDLDALFRVMSTSRLPKPLRASTRYRYAKTSGSGLWYLLTVLKRLQGMRRFNLTTGLRYWDGIMVMVDTPALTDRELIRALNLAKRLLLTSGINPESSTFDEQTAQMLLYDICCLHKRMVIRISLGQAIPEWADILPRMSLKKCL